MVTPDQRARAKAIQRRTGLPFHVATRCLPERVRHPTYVLYGFFRLADQVVDDVDSAPPDTQRATLHRYRDGALGRCDPEHPIVASMADVVRTHDIPATEVEAFIDAMLADVDSEGYGSLSDLDGYMRGSAVAVARMMLAVMDPPDARAARPHADALGQAFQLTNFLRDVREDRADLGRVYLPEAVLDRHGASIEDLDAERANTAVAAAVRELLGETERRYRRGVAGIGSLPSDCQFGVLLAAVYYAQYHRPIRRGGYDVLGDPPSLSRRHLAMLVGRTAASWLRHRDPERVFYAISPLEPDVDPRRRNRRTVSAPGGVSLESD
ncbi:MAG: phytoene/squalene synthase family protein [Halobacteriales archaeon]